MNLVILTGAGISAESGVPTFRASDGLWAGHRIEDVATPEAFIRSPQTVYDFYNARRALLKEVAPNPAHFALAELQKVYPGQVTLITQNVDDLHERAGSAVVHMHGKLRSVWCLACDVHSPWQTDFDAKTACPACHKTGKLRPDIVWFGEIPWQMAAIEQALSVADYFVAIGTSGLVYPAAGFGQLAKQVGAKTLEINLEKTVASAGFDAGEYGLASEAVPRWVRAMLA